MAPGNWMPELVDAAGGVNLFGETSVHSPWLEWSEVVAADPDIIVVMPCGFNLARASSEILNLTERPEWLELTAVRNGKVFVVDGHHYFNRPGPRLLDSLEILCEIIHHERFSFGHRGRDGSIGRPLRSHPVVCLGRALIKNFELEIEFLAQPDCVLGMIEIVVVGNGVDEHH